MVYTDAGPRVAAQSRGSPGARVVSKPFRWTIAKREQLGGLLAAAPRINPHRRGFLNGVRRASAKIIALADDADLAFVGRTPENFFDYLSGAFDGMTDAPRLHLVHFSLRWAGSGGIAAIPPEKLAGFHGYLRSEGIDAAAICDRQHPLALVDFVARGGTMQNFIRLLHLQAARAGVDWNAVQRRLRIIGLRVRTHNSPNTWRWQQHQNWLGLIPDVAIKNVSVPAELMLYLANDQPKTTQPFHPGRWDDPEYRVQASGADQQRALALAAGLYDAGRTRTERLRLAAAVAAQVQMRQRATRRVVSRLKRL